LALDSVRNHRLVFSGIQTTSKGDVMEIITNELFSAALGALTFFASIIILVLVLIKSFKNGGVLHGLLGLFTGGAYTFAWGWISSRRLQMTRTMLTWTVCVILCGAMVYVSGGPNQMLRSIPWAGELGLVSEGSYRSAVAKNVKRQRPKQLQNRVVARKITAPVSQQNADWSTQAATLWKDGRFVDTKKAALLLGKAIQKDPGLAEAYNNRGNAYRDMEQYGLAMQDYNKAISLNPKLEKTFNNRGNIYFDQRNFEMAIEDYNRALALNPSYNLAYLNRGLAYHALKKNHLACPDFKKACELGDCDGIGWARRSGVCE
jgi:Tfp pilus assembly protein PilF